MQRAKNKKPAQRAAHFFAVFGYLSLLLEWFWTFGILLYANIDKLRFLFPKSKPVHSEPLFVIDGFAALVVGVIVTALVIALTLYALYAVPRDLAKTSGAATHNAAKAATPFVVHQQNVPKKEKTHITYTLTLLIKAVAIAIPIMCALCIPDFMLLPKDIVVVMTMFFAIGTLVHFGIEACIVKIHGLNTDTVW